MIRPNGSYNSPTGSEAKSDRTVKGAEASKSLKLEVQSTQGKDRLVEGNVAPATETSTTKSDVRDWNLGKQTGKGKEDVE